jgi:hypothetical protein
VEVLGIRHHGPGSARSVLGALDELDPDVLVIEGPPELDALVASAADPDLVPPVAALAYAVDTPRRATFYPLAAFSPEWVALRWAASHGVPARFADLSATHSLAEREAGDPPGVDAIGALARAAGYDDAERWWEDAVEHRSESRLEGFVAIREAMAAVRAEPVMGSGENELREAAMRRVLRAVLKEGATRVAVVCGAFHAPVLHPDAWPPATRDNKLLSGLPRTKVATTWVPWTADRLAASSGYGAGVSSPGWYQHLFVSWQHDQDVVAGWLTRVARELRSEGMDAAPATVVEAVRMADALAAVRARPLVGLSELTDAVQTVLCGGSALPLRLVEQRLVIGEELGRVPDSVPLTPLAQDVARLQRSLRLKPSASPSTITLDLRKEAQRDRSVFLHRLALLGVPWGAQSDAGRSLGTFKEAWDLRWAPELAVGIIEAGLHGTTVLEAAEAKVAQDAREAADLATLSGLVEACLTADLPRALTVVVDTLADRTARQHDTFALLEAVEPLARTQRYGDVRGADTSRVTGVLHAVVTRASVGLRAACSSLDDDAATAARRRLDAADRGVALVDDPELSEPWRTALLAVAADDRIHGALAGRTNRILLDQGAVPSAEVARRMSRRLSVAADALAGAAWVDGFLEGDVLLLLHDAALLQLVDAWVSEAGESTFEDLLPLLRRTFARFDGAARRQIGTRLRQPGAAVEPDEFEIDLDRGLPAARRVAELLGLQLGGTP